LDWVKSQKGDESEDVAESKDGGGEPSTEPKEGTNQAPQEEKPSPPKKDDKPKDSALANFHRRQQEFEAQRQAFAAERREHESALKALKNAKTDRIAALEAMGYSDVKSFLEGLAEDGGRMTPERQQLQELRQWKESQEKAAEEAKAAQEKEIEQTRLQQKLDAIRSEVQSKLKSDYASRLVNISGADQQILQEMDRMASETGEMPEIEEAVEAVESRFRENLKSLSENPEIRKYFQEVLKSSPSAPLPSKTKGKISTIGSEVRNPGLAPTEEYVPSEDGEKELQEALAFLNKRKGRR
jgi:DNA repair exonuclease SbcCD ATPase subunit